MLVKWCSLGFLTALAIVHSHAAVPHVNGTAVDYAGFSWESKFKKAMESVQGRDLIRNFYGKKNSELLDRDLSSLFNQNRLSLELFKDISKWPTQSLDLVFLQDEEWLNRALYLTELMLLQSRFFQNQQRWDLSRENISNVLKVSQKIIDNSRQQVGLRLGQVILEFGLRDLQRFQRAAPDLVISLAEDQKILASLTKILPIPQVLEGEKETLFELAKKDYDPHDDGGSLLKKFFSREPQKNKEPLQKLKSFFSFISSASIEDLAELLLLSQPRNFDVESLQKELEFQTQKWRQRFVNNPYQSFAKAVQNERVSMESQLKNQLGDSWPWVQKMFSMSRPSLQEPPPPKMEWNRLKRFYASTINPLGRLFLIAYLTRIEKLWTDEDVESLKIHLSRVQLLHAWSAVREFKKRRGHWPESLDEVVNGKLLSEIPKDYFQGLPLLYLPGKKLLRMSTSVSSTAINDEVLSISSGY